MEIFHFFLEFLKDPLTTLNAFVQTYGVWVYVFLFFIVFLETGVVVTPILPGDSLLFAVGLIAGTSHNESINIVFIIPILIFAALCGDNLNYFIGKKFGDLVQSKEKILFLRKSHIEQTEEYFKKYGGKTIIIARFIPIVRTIAPFVAGAGEMSYPKYISYCILGAVLWVTTITLMGYFLGNIPWVQHNFEKVVLGIVVISGMPIVWKLLQGYLKK